MRQRMARQPVVLGPQPVAVVVQPRVISAVATPVSQPYVSQQPYTGQPVMATAQAVPVQQPGMFMGQAVPVQQQYGAQYAQAQYAEPQQPQFQQPYAG